MLPPPGRRPGGEPGGSGEPEPPARPPLPKVTRGKGNAKPGATVPAKRNFRPPQGAMTPEQRKVTPTEESAFAVLEAEFGGREAMVGALSLAQLPKDLTTLLGMLADPLHDHESLAKVCALANVPISKLMKACQEAIRVRGQLLAHKRIADALPDVAAAVMAEATPGWKQCLECLGARTVQVLVDNTDEEGKKIPGQHEETIQCKVCKGRGLVWHAPDHDVQKTALKIGGVLDTGKGMSVQVLQNNTQVNPGDTGNYDKMMEALDGVLYGAGRERLAATRADHDEEWVDGEQVGEGGGDGGDGEAGGGDPAGAGATEVPEGHD